MVGPMASTPSVTPRTVLIVEDESTSRRALAMLLGSYGYLTSAVASAEEAVSLLRRGVLPEVALVDLDLPGMNGLELIKVIEKLDPGVRPVLVTGADTERLEAALRDRHIDCLRKPLEFGRLLALLNAPNHN
jgi:two-component system, NtrC family, C4-dicarboxylate transport response regulator DctD